MEYGYELFNFFVYKVFGSIQWLYLIVAAFNTAVIRIILRNVGRKELICLYFYFCLIYLPLQMGVVRQSIAISFAYLAMLSFVTGRSLFGLLMCCISVSFQYSAIAYLFVLFSGLTKFLLKKSAVFLFFVISYYTFGDGVASSLSFIFSHIGIPLIYEKLSVYLEVGGGRDLFQVLHISFLIA